MGNWKRNILLWRREWHRTIRLDNGWKVRMDFWFWNYPDLNESDAAIALITYRGLYIHKWTWRKEGKRVGPGGTTVASAALKLLNDVERIAPEKAKHDHVYMSVGGANIEFYLLYRQLLSKRGYWESEELLNEYEPTMLKELR